MEQIFVPSRAEWRDWLTNHHDREQRGVWLVFYRKSSGHPSLEYDESVEEALCFGWIDSIVKNIDDTRYCRKFTPRHNNSIWSPTNRKRAEKLIRERRMTPVGLAKIRAAKASGKWLADSRPIINTMPPELSDTLAQNPKARAFFDTLAPSYQKHFIIWITTAKKPETKSRRLKESLALLTHHKKLGPK